MCIKKSFFETPFVKKGLKTFVPTYAKWYSLEPINLNLGENYSLRPIIRIDTFSFLKLPLTRF